MWGQGLYFGLCCYPCRGVWLFELQLTHVPRYPMCVCVCFSHITMWFVVFGAAGSKCGVRVCILGCVAAHAVECGCLNRSSRTPRSPMCVCVFLYIMMWFVVSDAAGSKCGVRVCILGCVAVHAVECCCLNRSSGTSRSPMCVCVFFFAYNDVVRGVRRCRK